MLLSRALLKLPFDIASLSFELFAFLQKGALSAFLFCLFLFLSLVGVSDVAHALPSPTE